MSIETAKRRHNKRDIANNANRSSVDQAPLACSDLTDATEKALLTEPAVITPGVADTTRNGGVDSTVPDLEIDTDKDAVSEADVAGHRNVEATTAIPSEQDSDDIADGNTDESAPVPDDNGDESAPVTDDDADERAPVTDDNGDESAIVPDDNADESAPVTDDNGDESEPVPDNNGDESAPVPDDNADERAPVPDDNGDESVPIQDDNGDESAPVTDDNGDESAPVPDDDNDDESAPVPDDTADESVPVPDDNADESVPVPDDNADDSTPIPNDNGNTDESAAASDSAIILVFDKICGAVYSEATKPDPVVAKADAVLKKEASAISDVDTVYTQSIITNGHMRTYFKAVVRLVRGSLNQFKIKSRYRGNQCTSMAYIALCRTAVATIDTWTPAHIDKIIRSGNKLHNVFRNKLRLSTVADGRISLDDLPRSFKVEVESVQLEATLGRAAFAFSTISPAIAEFAKEAGMPSIKDFVVKHTENARDDMGFLLTVRDYSYMIFRTAVGQWHIFDSHGCLLYKPTDVPGTLPASVATFATPEQVVSPLIEKHGEAEQSYIVCMSVAVLNNSSGRATTNNRASSATKLAIIVPSIVKNKFIPTMTKPALSVPTTASTKSTIGISSATTTTPSTIIPPVSKTKSTVSVRPPTNAKPALSVPTTASTKSMLSIRSATTTTLSISVDPPVSNIKATASDRSPATIKPTRAKKSTSAPSVYNSKSTVSVRSPANTKPALSVSSTANTKSTTGIRSATTTKPIRSRVAPVSNTKATVSVRSPANTKPVVSAPIITNTKSTISTRPATNTKPVSVRPVSNVKATVGVRPPTHFKPVASAPTTVNSKSTNGIHARTTTAPAINVPTATNSLPTASVPCHAHTKPTIANLSTLCANMVASLTADVNSTATITTRVIFVDRCSSSARESAGVHRSAVDVQSDTGRVDSKSIGGDDVMDDDDNHSILVRMAAAFAENTAPLVPCNVEVAEDGDVPFSGGLQVET